ncbi:MAG: sialate O-acetylesterase [Oscillospiraceae bacterium]
MGKFKASPLFSDGMVLQRGKNIVIFGTGEDGTEITATLCGLEANCVVADGKWKVVFPPMGACRFMNLTLEDDNPDDTITFDDVAIGEVWIAGGQSNMKFELGRSATGKFALESDDTPDVRYFNVPRRTIYDEDYDSAFEGTSWHDFSDKEDAYNWSAAAYYAAKEISSYLDVVVGIIGCNWSNTFAVSWLDRDSALRCASDYLADYDEGMSKTTPDEANAAFGEYLRLREEWDKKEAEYYETAENPTEKGCIAACGDRPEIPIAPCSPRTPSLLFESMVKRIAPYTVQGVFWYQGESDDVHPKSYYSILANLIRSWRDEWKDDEITFIIGQLPVYGGDNPDGDELAVIRDAQLRIYNTIKNTGLAVLLDLGERDEIHPRDKSVVGWRFAIQALDIVYGGCDGAYAPVLKNALVRGDTIELQFKYASGGLVAMGEADGFEVCGEDGVYRPVYADISGERIFLSLENIKHPCGIRYLWKNYADVHIFSQFNLPLVPFEFDKI